MPSLRRCVVLAAVALVGRRSGAQTCVNTPPATSCTVPAFTGTLSINAASRMSLSAATTTITAPRAADFRAGTSNTTGPTLTVSSNGAFRVVVSSTDATWKRNGVASTKPVADLGWAAAAGGSYNALSTGASSKNLNGTQTGATASLGLPIFYQVTWKWTQDVPGTYTLPVVFTLVSP